MNETTKMVKGFLKNNRLVYLMGTPEFRGIRGSLLEMEIILDKGGILSEEQIELLHQIELHIHKIQPHVEIIQVNGEDVPVQFVTKL